jgi:hypothetical protein
MPRSAIRLLTLAICATAVVMVPMVTAAEGEASSRHFRKHHDRHGLNDSPGHSLKHSVRRSPFTHSWASQPIRPVAQPSYGGDVCPGSGRSFECKVWPPPFDQDPDRKVSGTDGG